MRAASSEVAFAPAARAPVSDLLSDDDAATAFAPDMSNLMSVPMVRVAKNGTSPQAPTRVARATPMMSALLLLIYPPKRNGLMAITPGPLAQSLHR